MTHNTQLLIATERERWLKLHLEGGLTIKRLSQRSGFSRDTLHRWKKIYLKQGLDGLKEKSRAHHNYPKTTPQEIVLLVRKLRFSQPCPGAKRIALRLERKHNIKIYWQTVHKILKREGLVKKRKRLPTKERWTKKTFISWRASPDRCGLC